MFGVLTGSPATAERDVVADCASLIFWASLEVFAAAEGGKLCEASSTGALATLLVLAGVPAPSPRRLLAAIAARADGFLGVVDGIGEVDVGVDWDFRAKAASETLPIPFLD